MPRLPTPEIKSRRGENPQRSSRIRECRHFQTQQALSPIATSLNVLLCARKAHSVRRSMSFSHLHEVVPSSASQLVGAC